MPRAILDNMILKESIVNNFMADPTYGQVGKEPSSKKYWIVYSDRADNNTYVAPGSTRVYKTLGWNEPLRIARISGKYALVYVEPNKKVKWPKISPDAICMGWIPMDHLLLWDTCLADDKGILYKALVCRNVDATQSSSSGKRYLHPTMQSKSVSMDSGIRFYFIMKRDKGGKVLLASQNHMNGASDKVLFGWLSQSSFIPWNQRSCIEPTWDEDDVRYLACKKAAAKIYDNEGDQASTWNFQIKGGENDDYKYRMAPSMLRFPILDGTNETTYECSSFGSQDVAADERRKDIYEKLLNINFTIVIDGTKSMGKYFPAVYKAIQEGCEFFDEQKYKIKVGVVIYRDYADGEHGLVEVFPFSRPDDKNLFDFLQSGGSYGIKSAPADKTHTEALFYGINEALDKLKVRPGESNVMLIVGDCGNAANDPKGPTQKEIEEKLIKKGVNLLSFQVRNQEVEAWDLFNKQMQLINANILQAKYDDILKGTKVISKRRADGYEFQNSARREEGFSGAELFFGVNKYATVGTEIQPEVLTNLMKNTLKRYADVVQYQVDITVNPPVVSVSDEVKNATGFVQDRKWFEKKGLTTSTDLLAFRGTTPKYYNGEIQFYKPILFITSEELTELLRRLEPVYQVANNTNSDYRKPYIDAIKALLKSFVPELTSAQMDQMGVSNITKMIQGLNESSASMNEYTLLEIAEKVPPQKYRTLVRDFANKYLALRTLKDAGYKYVKDFNNAKYYWIPIEYLP